MHWLDLVLLTLLGLGAGLGYWSGLIMQIARLVCLGVSLYVTILLNAPVTQFLHERIAPEAHVNLLRGIAYVAVFLVVYVALFALSRLLYKAVRETRLEVFDRLAGAALGALKMALLLAPVCALLAFLALPITDEWMKQSTIAPLLAKGLQRALVMVPEEYKDQAKVTVEQAREQLRHEATDRAIDLLKVEESLKK